MSRILPYYHSDTCYACEGDGYVEVDHADWFTRTPHSTRPVECDRCKGGGRFHLPDDPETEEERELVKEMKKRLD